MEFEELGILLIDKINGHIEDVHHRFGHHIDDFVISMPDFLITKFYRSVRKKYGKDHPIHPGQGYVKYGRCRVVPSSNLKMTIFHKDCMLMEGREYTKMEFDLSDIFILEDWGYGNVIKFKSK